MQLEAATLPPDAVEVGRIGDAHGIMGAFWVLAHSAVPEALFSTKRWFIEMRSKNPKAPKGVFSLPVAQAKEQGDGIVARCAEVQTRGDAELLKGAQVFVPRSSFPTLPEGEFYWVDLIGLAVVNREGLHLGTVKSLLSTGPQSVIVMDFEGPDGAPAERMIPFVDAYVIKVSLADKRIDVDWLPEYDV